MPVIIRSTGFGKPGPRSGVYHNETVHQSTRGINLYYIRNNEIELRTYDTCVYDMTDDIINQISLFLASNCRYLIAIVDDEASSGLNTARIVESLPQLHLKHLTSLGYRDSYYFVYDNLLNKLINERISKTHSISNSYEYNSGTLLTGPNVYLVCEANLYAIFYEYINSFRYKLDLIFLLLTDTNQYNYVDDPNEVYIFCQSVDNHFNSFAAPTDSIANRKFNRLVINMEQMTITSRYEFMKWHIERLIPMIDYSLENMQITKQSLYLPYQYDEVEINKLKHFYDDTKKLYDVAFCGAMSYRRQAILNQLRNLGLRVFEIWGWYDERDIRIACCKVLINIHYDTNYGIYESIRCDRWAFAGMPVISENSIHNELLDVKKYNVVMFYEFDDLAEATNYCVKNLPKANEFNIELVRKRRAAELNRFSNELDAIVSKISADSSDQIIPDAIVDQIIPDALVDQIIPDAIVDQIIPEAIVDQIIPEVIVDQIIPEAIVDQIIPEAIVDQIIPEAIVDQIIPDAVADQIIPDAVADQIIPDAVADQIIPDAVADQIIPDAVVDRIIPEAVLDQIIPDVAVDKQVLQDISN
jgi:hypothetical protein